MTKNSTKNIFSALFNKDYENVESFKNKLFLAEWKYAIETKKRLTSLTWKIEKNKIHCPNLLVCLELCGFVVAPSTNSSNTNFCNHKITKTPESFEKIKAFFKQKNLSPDIIKTLEYVIATDKKENSFEIEKLVNSTFCALNTGENETINFIQGAYAYERICERIDLENATNILNAAANSFSENFVKILKNPA